MTCEDEDDDSEQLGGAIVSVFGSKRGVGPVTSIHPDRIGIYDTDIEAYRVFSVGGDIPAHVLAELTTALNDNTRFAELSSAVMPFELKN